MMSDSSAAHSNSEAAAAMGLFSLSTKESDTNGVQTEEGGAHGDIEGPSPSACRKNDDNSTSSAASIDGQTESKSGEEPIKPRTNDILSGRGNGANQHAGNIYFRNLIASYKRKYVLSEPTIKKQITSQVLGIIKSRKPPGRFLKQVSKDGSWKELDRDTALRKTAQALREKAPELKKKVLEEAERKDLFQIAKTKKQKMIQPSLIIGRSGIEAAYIDTSGHSGQLNNSYGISFQQINPQSQQQPSAVALPAFIQQHNAPLQGQHQIPLNLVSVPNTASLLLQPSGVVHASAATTSMPALQNAAPPPPPPAAATMSIPDSRSSSATVDSFLYQKADGRATDASNVRSPTAELMDFGFNYEDMTISSLVKERLTNLALVKRRILRATAAQPEITQKQKLESLRDISILASMSCCDLTALYMIVRMKADAFTSSLHFSLAKEAADEIIKPTTQDVIVNFNAVQNHPGNLKLGECIHSYRSDFLQAGNAEQTKAGIVLLVHASITKEGKGSTDKKGRFLVYNRNEEWELISAQESFALIRALFEQACAFILYPDTNDVLFGKDDKSRLSPGTIFFRSFVDRCKPLFIRATEERRIQYATEIVSYVTKNTPGRFLGYLDKMGMWIPLTFETAILKTQGCLAENDEESLHSSHRSNFSPASLFNTASLQIPRTAGGAVISNQVGTQVPLNALNQVAAISASPLSAPPVSAAVTPHVVTSHNVPVGANTVFVGPNNELFRISGDVLRQGVEVPHDNNIIQQQHHIR